MGSLITKNNLPDWIKAYGINWIHKHFQPKDDHETFLLEYLERNGELVGLILSILALLRHLNPLDDIFTQPDKENGKNEP